MLFVCNTPSLCLPCQGKFVFSRQVQLFLMVHVRQVLRPKRLWNPALISSWVLKFVLVKFWRWRFNSFSLDPVPCPPFRWGRWRINFGATANYAMVYSLQTIGKERNKFWLARLSISFGSTALELSVLIADKAYFFFFCFHCTNPFSR